MSEIPNNPSPPVTVIIVAHNTPDLLVQCLQEFYDRCSEMGWQTIVVDNGSEEEIGSAIDRRFDGIEVIRSERNLGFAGGNNTGLLKAKGEFVILMNSDIIAQAEILSSLVKAIRADPQIGAMSPGLLTAEGKPQAFAFGSKITPSYLIRRAIRRLVGWGYVHDWSIQKPIDVGWVSAACICVRRRTIEEVGDLDERFPLYFEDADWGLRMSASGWRVVYNPLLRVTHLGGASQIRGPATRENLYYRSLLLFCEKHYGIGWKLVLRPLLTLYRIFARTKLLILEKIKPVNAEPVQSRKPEFDSHSIHDRNRGEAEGVLQSTAKGEELPAGAYSVNQSRNKENYSIPEFSIIMPVWNRAALVPRAIESVLKQSFNGFELIIVDDGSEDELEKTVTPFLTSPVFYHRIEHRGAAAARNAGLALAKGRYIAYLDSDNVWDPRFLEAMKESLTGGYTPRHVAYCMYRLFTKGRTGEWSLHAIRGEEFDFGTLLKRNYIDLNTLVHSKQAARETGDMDERLSRLSDWDYTVRLASRYNPLFVPKPMVDYYFGFAPNALTLNYRESESRKVILRKNSDYKHSITISHDAVSYHFNHVSGKKYRNWIEMNKPLQDTSSFSANGYPYIVQIEPTNRCNPAYPFYPSGRRELRREGRGIRFEEYRPVVDELADYLLLLVLYDWGEPLLNQDFPKMVQYAKERGIRTMTSSNGHALNNEAFVAEIMKGGLDTLIVSVDSLDQKTYELFRKNGDIGKVMEGIRKTVSLKRRIRAKTRINMRMVVTRYNEGEIGKMRDVARSLGVDVFSIRTVNPNSGGILGDDSRIVPANPRYRRYKYKKGTMDKIHITGCCHYVWSLANISANGNVLGCCYDYDGLMTMGNIHKESFRAIWDGKVARGIREKVWSNKDSILRCRDCDINFALTPDGWFPEYIDFTAGPIDRVKQKVKRSAVGLVARKMIRLIR
jgi:N-acetylglucosaminyl-diphospho-decaprenol L-rhamnosyltransferase